MIFKGILSQLNLPLQCKKYGVPLWQCPQFLFLVMGILVMASALAAFLVGTRYIEQPELVALIVLLITLVLLIISFIITRSFEALAEANRMKSEFVSIVSHQLRAPLSNLRWAIELLMSGRLGNVQENQLEYFKILKENNARMQELVSNLLLVSKIETAGLVSKKEEIALQDIAGKLIEESKPFIKASNIEIDFNPEKGLPKILADSFQIRLVIDNLLNNAARYIKEKGKIKIVIKRINNNLYFEITDNGVGIPKDDQKYIFQKFFRSKNALQHQTEGTGLGLYICKAIIEKSGGKIGFKSEENKGSTFWFTLPLTN